jgi:hypothetical protein
VESDENEPNVGNDVNVYNDGNASEPLGLQFFVVGKQTMISAQNSLFVCIN